jgi:hypothetical protein
MGLIDRLLPERLPRQFVYAGEDHAEVVALARGRVAGRRRVAGAALADGAGWDDVLSGLRPEETGLVFSASPFLFNFFEFDQLPWQAKALGELVTWRLQKIFPGDIAAHYHRYYRLDRRRVLSILAPRALVADAEARFAAARVPLTFIGSSTLALLARLRRARPAPDFFIESAGNACTMLFQARRQPVYVRKFRAGSAADAADEAAKTVAFVRGQYGIEPGRYWLIEHEAGTDAGAPLLAALAGQGEAPYIPGCR